MRRIALSLLILFSGVQVFGAEAWTIDDAHSAIRFKVTHMMLSKVSGEITGLKGKAEYKDGKLVALDGSADLETITTSNAKRDAHLKSPDFFDAKKYPTLAFKSTKVEQQDGKYKITGTLTMHGVTKPVTFEAEAPDKIVKDPWGNQRRLLTVSTKINRQDWGVKWNKNLDGGGVVVGDEVDVTAECELVGPKKNNKG